jgi:O-acetylhomoserine (thiol)-lyase
MPPRCSACKAFGNIYTRIMNPTQAVLEERVAALEGGTAALAVASGHAAQLLVFHTIMSPGDNFIAATSSTAARSTSSATPSRASAGMSAGPIPPTWEASRPRSTTRPRRSSSRASPTRRHVTDIEAIAEVARKHGMPLIVDNTMASPYLCQPIEHGADIVVHSLTKFIGGHGNSMGGVIVDGGTFDWSKSGKYPMLSEPRPEYGGMVLHETFGNFAFAIACRVLGLRDLGPRSRRSTPS